jgi:hypothetical protein
MSTEGNAQVCLVAFLEAGAQAGVLLEKGAVWLGDQLINNYKAKCQQWTDLYEAVRAESRSQVDQVNGYLTTQLMHLAAPHAQQSGSTTQVRKRLEQQKLREAITQARRAIDDGKQAAYMQVEIERALRYARLSSAIETGRGILAKDVITRAEGALSGSVEVMQQASDELEASWQQVTTTQAQEKKRRQARQALQTVSRQLASLAELVQEAPATYRMTFATQQKTIQAMSEASNQVLEQQPGEAFRLATEAQQRTQSLSTTVSEHVLGVWDTIRSEINTLQGSLTTLKNLLSEASSINLTGTQEIGDLNSHINATHDELEELVEYSLADVDEQLPLLRERVTLLKQDVFTLVQTQQQRSIAQTITTTLAELGFQSLDGGEPTLKENGEMLRIGTMRSSQRPDTGRDDRVVSFDIGRDGAIAYDFSGYTGEACLQEAETIFAGFQQKGLFLLDKRAAQHLHDYPVERITPELLNQRHLQPHLSVNKVQAELAERIHTVLQQMQYQNVRQQAIGGCIELEAFNGTVGYRVVLSPEGSAQIFKDGKHLNLSPGTTDPIVTETQHVQGQQEQAQIESARQEQTESYLFEPEKPLLEN